MNFLNVFEQRVGSLFGATAQGLTAPFSFKKLAKKAAREMEAETFVIDGVDTAPALYTILVSSDDDLAMRPLYQQLTNETAQFIEGQAQNKGYVFVGQPVVRFMADPSLRSGRFSVFAENVDLPTLNRLREEEAKFMGAETGFDGGLGGAASQPLMPAAAPQVSQGGPLQVSANPMSGTDAGLDVLPQETVLDAEEAALDHVRRSQAVAAVPSVAPLHQEPEMAQQPATPAQPQVAPAPAQQASPMTTPVSAGMQAAVPVMPIAEGMVPAQASVAAAPVPSMPIIGAAGASRPAAGEAAKAAAQPVAPQQQPSPQAMPQQQVAAPARQQMPSAPVTVRAREAVPAPSAAPISCLLIDRQSGRTYTGSAPRTIIGRERTPGGIVLRDPNVSRSHAELSFDGQGWRIRDLNSTNGTLVNDVDVDECPLRDGDLITLGLVNLEFREN